MKHHNVALAALVFGAGTGSLATEISASRLLAPYFGSSTIVWANLIGIVLAGLAFGYWLGGRLADRRPEPRLLGTIVLAAAVWVAAIPFVARPFLDAAVGNLDEASAGAVVGSFFAVLLLFAPAVVLLGMVAPFAIRLAITSVETAGAVAGRLYALSTAGSLVGHVRARAHLDPARRDAAHAARLRRAARALGVVAARPAGGRARGGACRARRGSARRDQGGARAAARGGLAVPVHPGGRAGRRQAAAAPERGRRRPLRLAARHRADRRRLGRVPRAAAAPRPAVALGRDPRQRGRHDGARSRRLLSAGEDRRRRARSRCEPRRAPLVRPGRQPAR